MMLRPGDEVDARYRVVRHLATGGMSDIYEAEDRSLGRHVALKLLHDPEGAHALAREQLLAEGRITALLSHANIVHIYEVGSDGRFDYIAMELLQGEPLAGKLAREGALTLAEVLRLGIELTEALEAVHARGIVHGDIKPSNVFLTRSTGQGSGLKLLDFGVAQRIGAVREARAGQGPLVGTLSYMAPEQFRERWPADARSDLWSVGVVLYEMLTGQRPFEAAEDSMLLLTVAIETPRPLREQRPGLPQELCDLVERALHRDVRRRFQSAAELAAALRRVGARRVRRGPASRRLEGPSAVASRASMVALPRAAASGEGDAARLGEALTER